jgi:hypothetical protein
VSLDGRSWTVAGVARPDATFSRGLATSTGFTAAGSFLDVANTPRVAWFSRDGTSWRVLANAPRLSGVNVRSFAANGFGIVSMQSPGKVDVYTTSDGSTWSVASADMNLRSLGVTFATASGAVLLTGPDDQGISIWMTPPGG